MGVNLMYKKVCLLTYILLLLCIFVCSHSHNIKRRDYMMNLSGSSSGTHMSTCEQFAVSKGGVSIVFGDSSQGLIWSNTLSDYLFTRFVAQSLGVSKDISSRKGYTMVVCILVDRSKEDIYRLLSSHSSGCRVVCIEDFDCDSSSSHGNSKRDGLDFVLDELRNCLSELEDGDVPAVMVYSATEIILKYSFSKAIIFFESIKSILKLDVLYEGTSLSGPTKKDPALVLTVHQSLHPTNLLSRLQKFANVSLIVKPNTGTLAEDVVAEVCCVRRSNATGKVKEEVDMFVANNPENGRTQSNTSLIAPVVRRKMSEDQNEEDDSTDSKTLDTIEAFKAAVLDDNANEKADQRAKTRHSSTVAKQLVTFDSTDPDFDEDDDPDNDLDL